MLLEMYSVQNEVFHLASVNDRELSVQGSEDLTALDALK